MNVGLCSLVLGVASVFSMWLLLPGSVSTVHLAVILDALSVRLEVTGLVSRIPHNTPNFCAVPWNLRKVGKFFKPIIS